MTAGSKNHDANTDGIALSNSEFLRHLLVGAIKGSTVWVNSFLGDPNGADQSSWAGKVYNPGLHAAEVDAWVDRNTYCSVSAVRSIDGVMYRRKSHFARLLALVADDVNPDELHGTPSWGFLTSPGKRQIGVLLDRDDPDCANAELVHRLFVAMGQVGLVSLDRSGNNAVRYIRLPGGTNLKARETGPHRVVVEYWNPANRYSLEDAAGIFGLDLDDIRQETLPSTITQATQEQEERLAIWTGNILRGEALHDSINQIAASMVASGAKGGAVVNLLRGLMNASMGPRDERWRSRYHDIVRAVATAQDRFTPITPPATIIDADTGEIVPERPLFVSVGDLLSDLKPVQWLVENYLEADALSMMYGPSGGGKSFVAISLVCSIATGTHWFHCPVKQGAVFYIAGEGHLGLARRFAAWSKATGVPITRDTPLYKSERAVSMLDSNAVQILKDEVRRMIRAHGRQPELIVLDTLARNFGPGDENKQQDANRFIEALDELRREFKCHILIVHHSGHEMERARGSSVFRAAMDQEFQVGGANGIVELKTTKMKDAEMPAVRRFRIKPIGLDVIDAAGVEIQGAYLELDGSPLDVKVGVDIKGKDIPALRVVRILYHGWNGADVLAAELGASTRGISRMLSAMKDAGLVYQEGGSKRSPWALTELAIDQLSMTGEFVLPQSSSATDLPVDKPEDLP
jgi:hypothetical protein